MASTEMKITLNATPFEILSKHFGAYAAVIEAAKAYERIDAEPPFETDEAFESWSVRRDNAGDKLCATIRALLAAESETE